MDDLDDILNSGDVTLSRGSSFQGESDDEFDATALLSEPLFVDGDDVDNLNLSSEDVILDLDPDGGPPSGNNDNYQDPSRNHYQGYPSMPDSQSSSMQSYQQHEQQQEPQRRPPMRGLRPPPSFMSQNQQQQQQNQFSPSYAAVWIIRIVTKQVVLIIVIVWILVCKVLISSHHRHHPELIYG